MINRRNWIRTTSAGLATSVLAPSMVLADSKLPAAASESALIYLTPIRSDGQESRCQSEIWFVRAADDLYVVTAADAWRAQAVGKGLTETRIWVGDVGTWGSDGRYKQLPQVMAEARLVTAAGDHDKILTIMGGKYTAEWGTWGPRFSKGLADGSRVMIGYTVT